MPAYPTSTTVLDSILFRDAFGTTEMREVFSDLALISRYAEVEVALARDRPAHGCLRARFRPAASGNRRGRLSDPATGAPDDKTMR
jgi:hypothetical protein